MKDGFSNDKCITAVIKDIKASFEQHSFKMSSLRCFSNRMFTNFKLFSLDVNIGKCSKLLVVLHHFRKLSWNVIILKYKLIKKPKKKLKKIYILIIKEINVQLSTVELNSADKFVLILYNTRDC